MLHQPTFPGWSCVSCLGFRVSKFVSRTSCYGFWASVVECPVSNFGCQVLGVWCREGLSSDDLFEETSAQKRAAAPDQWLQRHPEAGSSWPSWYKASQWGWSRRALPNPLEPFNTHTHTLSLSHAPAHSLGLSLSLCSLSLTHTQYLSVSLSLFLTHTFSFCLSVCLSVCLSLSLTHTHTERRTSARVSRSRSSNSSTGHLWGLGFRVWGLGFGVWSLEFRVLSSGFRVQCLGFRAQGLGLRI